MIAKPQAGEYPHYFQRYTNLLPDEDILKIMDDYLWQMQQLSNRFSEEAASHRYAEGKWCVKEILGHIIDTERVFAYRGLCFSRNHNVKLPSFDQDEYVENANFMQRTLIDLMDEFEYVRNSSISLFKNMNAELLERTGIVSGYELIVRVIPFIIAGHELHHRLAIEKQFF